MHYKGFELTKGGMVTDNYDLFAIDPTNREIKEKN